jgi:dCMP deaminase
MNTEKYGKFNQLLVQKDIDIEISKLEKYLSPKFIAMHMKIAKEIVSELSYCKRLKVGSLALTANNEILIGYNGAPSGHPNVCELEGQDVTDPKTLHGEANTMSKAEQSTLSLKNASLFVTNIPCLECAKRIIQSGIRRVFYLDDYRLTEGLELLTDFKSGIQIIKLNENYEIEKIFSHYMPAFGVESKYLLDKINILENKILELQKNSCECKSCK